MAVSPIFARALRAGRSLFNKRVTEAKHRYPGFDTEAFSAFLQGSVDPVAKAVAEHSQAHVNTVIVAAYEVALDLVGRELAGPRTRSESINQLWQSVFPLIPSQIILNPTTVLGALSNALVNLESIRTARPAQWLELMEKHVLHIQDVNHLLQLGVLAAWLSGAVHFRQSALDAVSKLPTTLLASIFNTEETSQITTLVEKLKQNPWYLTTEKSIRSVGGFSGYGELFVQPPQVRAVEDAFLLKSENRFYALIADSCGHVFLPSSEEEFQQASLVAPDVDKSNLPKLSGTKLKTSQGLIQLDLPKEDLQLAIAKHTVAITSPFTFTIQLVPC